MKIANISKIIDLKYKNGFVKCSCGWIKELGNGFNGYEIDNCPSCTPEIETRNQRKVTTGHTNNYTVTIGNHIYFVLSNGLHIQYSRNVFHRYTGLSERKANNL